MDKNSKAQGGLAFFQSANFVFSIFVLLIVLFVAGGFWYIRGKNTYKAPGGSTQAMAEESAESPNASEQLPVSESQKPMSKPPAMQIDESKTNSVILHTEVGDITIELNAKQTPITANNFYSLAKKGFYDGTIFHRTIPGFMIQGGDPTGTGTGGPGYQFEDEPFEGEYTRGTVAMANAGPDTNGSQFFIMHKDYGLPPNYTIFGHVTEGMDVVDKIATAGTKPEGEGSTPVNPVAITKAEVVVE